MDAFCLVLWCLFLINLLMFYCPVVLCPKLHLICSNQGPPSAAQNLSRLSKSRQIVKKKAKCPIFRAPKINLWLNKLGLFSVLFFLFPLYLVFKRIFWNIKGLVRVYRSKENLFSSWQNQLPSPGASAISDMPCSPCYVGMQNGTGRFAVKLFKTPSEAGPSLKQPFQGCPGGPLRSSRCLTPCCLPLWLSWLLCGWTWLIHAASLLFPPSCPHRSVSLNVTTTTPKRPQRVLGAKSRILAWIRTPLELCL